MRKIKQHSHHFLLPEPSMDVPVIGKCKICGLTQEHNNIIPIQQWNTWRGKKDKDKKKV
jgi:hypothetical protein